jgi:hypothetical protein
MPYKIDGIVIDGIAEPVLGEGTTFVPLANVSQALGGYADFDHEAKVAKIELGAYVILVQADNPIIDINGTPVELQAAPYIEVDSMVVPVRLFEKLGYTLQVEGSTISLASA